ncbi:hypothetical protein SAICODRAFT_27699 [Saitoella complicata NRRL Y-17804]|uniref:uncharacterized protein n=1 Tax=Saitoella complicata (strain BCRC 22490 / CBS 7301 / JCM 7358 / NBRC 10748 / NRRL Y-17804) TaxID=698492 RepID=UPI000866CCB5|nr:uncharacterized protein SAICODRAFT_27699 [Saitoella complicata NRRL Y-17804]ODQ50247.1 hypothetical protein SAICODRAFT_27699 [Saitoella complicata NRRL Y-17804]
MDDDIMDLDDWGYIQEVTNHVAQTRQDRLTAYTFDSPYEDNGAYIREYDGKLSRGAVFVTDTNFLISQLSLVNDLAALHKEHGHTILIPWIVIRELDGLKSASPGRGRAQNVAPLARQAITWIHDNLKRNEGSVRGQQMTEALQRGLEPDDAILDCCQYIQQEEELPVVLLSNDRNLCVKALIHDIPTKSFSRGLTAIGILKEHVSDHVAPQTPRKTIRRERTRTQSADSPHTTRRSPRTTSTSPQNVQIHNMEVEMSDCDGASAYPTPTSAHPMEDPFRPSSKRYDWLEGLSLPVQTSIHEKHNNPICRPPSPVRITRSSKSAANEAVLNPLLTMEDLYGSRRKKSSSQSRTPPTSADTESSFKPTRRPSTTTTNAFPLSQSQEPLSPKPEEAIGTWTAKLIPPLIHAHLVRGFGTPEALEHALQRPWTDVDLSTPAKVILFIQQCAFMPLFYDLLTRFPGDMGSWLLEMCQAEDEWWLWALNGTGMPPKKQEMQIWLQCWECVWAMLGDGLGGAQGEEQKRIRDGAMVVWMRNVQEMEIPG